MQNLEIEKSKLSNIENNTTNLVGVINEGIAWLENYEKNNQFENYELKKYRRTLNKIKAVVTEKPAIALFGASQVGKSYMANNLLYNSDNKLMIYNHSSDNSDIDFLKQINPSGRGNESTSCVTRFTSFIQKPENTLPIIIKIFSPKDIIIILCDTYYSDFTYPAESNPTYPNKENLLKLTNEIKNYKSNTEYNYITEDDIYEIKEYIEKYFNEKPFVNSHKETLHWIDFWVNLANNIKYINCDSWVNIFEILWNKHKEISNLFSMCIVELKKLLFPKLVYANFDVLYNETCIINEQVITTSIIDVSTLDNFFNDIHFFQIQTENNQKTSITSSKLSFLCSEIVLTVAPSSVTNRPFINDSDIIDFPGARSRDKLQELSNLNLLKMLLRGKVSYLFNYYSSNYKTNILCACMRTEQANVNTVPGLLNQWIEDNLGNTTDIRTKNIKENKIPPLFIIFTWWNKELTYDIKIDKFDPNERITKLFNTRYSQEIISDFKWHKEWIYKDSKFIRFSNFYLLRDFNRSKEIFISEDGIEKNIENKDDKKEYYNNYLNKFLEYHNKENRFFDNPEENFNEASTPNKDGSELIIRRLTPIASNNVSVPIYLNAINQTLDKAKKILNNHYHSSISDELIKNAERQSSKIVIVMNQILGKDAYHFGSFIEHLTITEKEIYEEFHQLFQDKILVDKTKINEIIFFREYSPKLIIRNTETKELYDLNLAVLKDDYHFNTLEETEEYFKNRKIDLKQLFFGDCLPNKSDILAAKASELWYKKIDEIENFSFFINLGFDKDLLIELFKNLKISYSTKLNITSKIANRIKDYVDIDKKIDLIEDMLAHITAATINEFVVSAGWNYYSVDDIQKLKETNSVNKLNLTFPNDPEIFPSIIRVNDENSNSMSVEKLLDYMDNLNENLSKNPIDMKSIENVPMMKNYRRWRELMKISFIYTCNIPSYDIEGNRRLGGILDNLKKYDDKFSISK